MNANGGSGVLDYLKFGGSTASDLIGALNPAEQKIVQPATQQPAATNWTMIAIIGGAFVALFMVVLVFVSRKA